MSPYRSLGKRRLVGLVGLEGRDPSREQGTPQPDIAISGWAVSGWGATVHVTLMRSVSVDTIGQVVDTLFEALSMVTPFLSMILMGVGLLSMIIGATRWMRDGPYGGGTPLLISGALQVAVGAFLPTIVNAFAGSDGPQPEPTGTSTPAATPTSPPTSPPSQTTGDLTWLLTVLGIVAALILVVALVALITHVTGRARRSIRASRTQAATERATRDRLTAAWRGFHDRHDELLRKILHSETDWDSLFFLPALTDPNVPATYAMLRAMRSAGALRDTAGDMPDGLTDESDLTGLPYPKAVLDFSLAWDAADRNARRLGQKGVPAAERKLIKQIRTLLDIAENSAASQTERNLSYRRALKLIQSLESVHVPPQAVAQLEERQQLAIQEARP